MAQRMLRTRVLSAAAAWALSAVGFVTPAAGTVHVGVVDVPTNDALALVHEGPTSSYVAAPSDDSAFGRIIAGLSDGLSSLNGPIGQFGPFGSGESTSGAGFSASTVSAPVVVSADALWTFDAEEFDITSTISITEVNVGLRGHQAEIDRCAGPVVSDYGGWGKVIGEHNHCGGAYVLELEVGDVVRVTGYEAGEYVVAFLKDVPKVNTPVTVLSGAGLFLQTCHFTGSQMRLAALTPQ